MKRKAADALQQCPVLIRRTHAQHQPAVSQGQKRTWAEAQPCNDVTFAGCAKQPHLRRAEKRPMMENDGDDETTKKRMKMESLEEENHRQSRIIAMAEQQILSLIRERESLQCMVRNLQYQLSLKKI